MRFADALFELTLDGEKVDDLGEKIKVIKSEPQSIKLEFLIQKFLGNVPDSRPSLPVQNSVLPWSFHQNPGNLPTVSTEAPGYPPVPLIIVPLLSYQNPGNFPFVSTGYLPVSNQDGGNFDRQQRLDAETPNVVPGPQIGNVVHIEKDDEKVGNNDPTARVANLHHDHDYDIVYFGSSNPIPNNVDAAVEVVDPVAFIHQTSKLDNQDPKNCSQKN